MKILQIACPPQVTFAAFAVLNMKKAWVIARVPVIFFGLIPVGVETKEGGKVSPSADCTIEPLVYNFQGVGATIATAHPNFLGLEVMTTLNQQAKDWGKDLIAYVAKVEGPKAPVPEVKVMDKER